MTPYSDDETQVRQQQRPHIGEQCGDAKQSNRYGRETAPCHIRFAVGIVDVVDGDGYVEDRPVVRFDVIKRRRGDDEFVVVET
jgi:hypothetical protein